MIKQYDIIHPGWTVPATVKSISTTRAGGVSIGPWASLNLGDHCGDDSAAVRANRERLESLLPSPSLWLKQVHGTDVYVADENHDDLPEADAVVTSTPGQVLAILTADCLPVLLCDSAGSKIAAVHAGWRGLANGVIEATIAAMCIKPESLIAWLGPAIGQDAYEVGEDVFESFSGRAGSDRSGAELVNAFRPAGTKWHLDLSGAARIILSELGVRNVFGGNDCTHSDPARFFSHRRDGVTGRMASLIWLDHQNQGPGKVLEET